MSRDHLDTDQRRSGDHQDPDLHCSTEGGPPAGGEQMVGILSLFVETPSISLAVSNMCVGLFLEKKKTTQCRLYYYELFFIIFWGGLLHFLDHPSDGLKVKWFFV